MITCWSEFKDYYIYIIYTSNLEFKIVVSIWEREQSRFRESNEGARERSKGASRKHEEAWGSIEGALREHGGTSREQREPKAALLPFPIESGNP